MIDILWDARCVRKDDGIIVEPELYRGPLRDPPIARWWRWLRGQGAAVPAARPVALQAAWALTSLAMMARLFLAETSRLVL